MSRSTSQSGDEGRVARGLLVAIASVDLALRAWALADLATRSQDRVRGPKAAWALGLSVVNSVGLLPAAYLLWGRHADQAAER